MDLFVFLAVLAAAACHAGWNALLKLDLEPIVATSLVAVASGLIAVPFALVVGLPAAAAWPYVLASVAIHIVYYLALAQAYRHGDLGQVYPIARGTAPLMTAALATLWLGETLGPYGWAGVVVLAAGIVLLAVRGGRALQRSMPARSGFALLTSLTITAYTLVDGTRRAPVGIAAALHRLAVRAERRRHGRLRPRPHRPAAHRRLRRQLEAGDRRGRPVDRGLRHRHLGHDGGADRAGRRPARDQRAVRGAVRHRAAARAACSPRASPPPAWCWPASCWCGCADARPPEARRSRRSR